MNKHLRKQLENYFNELLGIHFASFSRTHTSGIYYTKGEFLYESKVGSRSKFILVEENPKGEASFRVQVGWSNFGRPPELPGRPLDFKLHTNDFVKSDEFFCNVFAIAGL